MDNDTRQKNRPASPEDLPDTSRTNADTTKISRAGRAPAADGTARRRRSSETRSADGTVRKRRSSETRSADGSVRKSTASKTRPADGTPRKRRSSETRSAENAPKKRRSSEARTSDGTPRKRPTAESGSVDTTPRKRPAAKSSTTDAATKKRRAATADLNAGWPKPPKFDNLKGTGEKAKIDEPAPETVDQEIDAERKARVRRRQKAEQRRKREEQQRLIIIAACAVAFLLLCFGIARLVKGRKSANASQPDTTQTANANTITTESTLAAESSAATTTADTSAPVKVTPDYEEISFEPHSTDATDPSNMFEYTGVNIDGEDIEDRESRAPFFSGEFGVPSAYTDVDGIVGFRGNNFRDDPTYGAVNTLTGSMEIAWTRQTGTMDSAGHTWSGNGWTGQPLMMKWPRDVKQHMNMYDSAKNKDDLVEVIYASMDGYIYFIDLETGEQTRDNMYLGYTFKGAGALDPRGYPIMYVGSGYNSSEGTSRVFVINLLDCSVMYTFGNDDSFALRNLSFFDSSALVDAETDTLIYPGENGILYLMHLNTQYDAAAGTLSIDPDNIIKWNYWGTRSSDENFWLGMEDSACIYKGYLFVCDNGGILWCLNLKTLRVVWAQDILDDSNGSPALSIENGHLYLYVSTSFHLGWRSEDTATVPIWKIDAETGEVVWKTDYTCYSESGVSGGVQSTPAIGRNSLDDYVYVTVAKTGDEFGGVLTCLNKATGEIVWEHSAVYTWSSPVCVYDSQGTGTVIYFTFDGKGYMLDGQTGDVKTEIQLTTECVEASPAVYNSRLVVGTRDCEFYGIDLK